ncbi:unnamed protein product [Phytophthora lilii]|uniref:Unnamed protein product n=1 Tax=Phytophthora lilii TaxID=2077276 RepID=A0A9W6TBG1_9STRA|nr:unnamed protein product [Phytophthora lilii]
MPLQRSMRLGIFPLQGLVAALDFATLYLKFPELKLYYSSSWNNNLTAILAQTKAASSLTTDWFVVQDIAINTLVAVGWVILGDLVSEYDVATAKTYYARNAAHEAAILERMWDSSLKRGADSVASTAVDRWSNAINASGMWEMWNLETGVGYGAEGLGMSETFVDALYRLGKIDSTNEYAGNGMTVDDLWSSGEVGSSSQGDAYDDSWWVLSYGNYSTIDRIDLAGGTRVDQIVR